MDRRFLHHPAGHDRAALIGALISLIGLVIAKESKVSEFRQAWIDELRKALTAFLTKINALVDLNNTQSLKPEDVTRREFELFSDLNNAYYSIVLRINSKETLSKNVQNCMVQLSKFVQDDSSTESFEDLRIKFLKSSRDLLKYEWNRVKRGEIVYRITQWGVGISAIGLLIALLFFMFSHFSADVKGKREKSATESVHSTTNKPTAPQLLQRSPAAGTPTSSNPSKPDHHSE